MWTEHWTTIEVKLFLSLCDILRLCATFCAIYANCMNTYQNITKWTFCLTKYQVVYHTRYILCLTKYQQGTYSICKAMVDLLLANCWHSYFDKMMVMIIMNAMMSYNQINSEGYLHWRVFCSHNSLSCGWWFLIEWKILHAHMEKITKMSSSFMFKMHRFGMEQ